MEATDNLDNRHGPSTVKKKYPAAGLAAVMAALLYLADQTALAGGLYVDQVGTPANLGTAGAANATNNFAPDAAWANQAGLVGIPGGRAMLGGSQILEPTLEFDSDVAEAGGSGGGDAEIDQSPQGVRFAREFDDFYILYVGGTLCFQVGKRSCVAS